MGSERGASMVEAALAVPIILIVLFGLVDFGRYIATTTTVTNASREAARYAAGTGVGSGTVARYADCDGMRDAARQFGVIAEPTDGQITLQFDEGPGTSVFLTCSGSSVTESDVESGDRIRVTVDVPYQPVTPLIDDILGPQTISATTVRSINKGSP